VGGPHESDAHLDAVSRLRALPDLETEGIDRMKTNDKVTGRPGPYHGVTGTIIEAPNDYGAIVVRLDGAGGALLTTAADFFGVAS
jgi:hypothetical protein